MFFRIFLLTTEPCCDIIIVLSNMVGVAQSIRAPGCGPGGRGFESHYSPHFDTKLRTELYEFEFIKKSYGFERAENQTIR